MVFEICRKEIWYFPILIFFYISASRPIEPIELNQLTESLRALPALNLGVLAAGISIFAPVWGFFPIRAARSPTLKVPNPTKATFSPVFRASVTASVNALRAFSASVLLSPDFSAIALTRSAFVTIYLPRIKKLIEAPPKPRYLYQSVEKSVKRIFLPTRA